MPLLNCRKENVMQKNLKSNNGITLITLVITIVVMLILSFTISINANDYIERTKKTNLDTDLQRLQEKVEIYYSKNKEIPVLNKYTNVAMLEKRKMIMKIIMLSI